MSKDSTECIIGTFKFSCFNFIVTVDGIDYPDRGGRLEAASLINFDDTVTNQHEWLLNK